MRRSAANNLGDIAKDQPDLAIGIATLWMAEDRARTPLVKHALRDLLRKRNRRALRLVGVGAKPAAAVARHEVVPRRIAVGGTAALRVMLRSTSRRAQTLRLGYAITYARPGGRAGRKVFKIADAGLAAGAALDLARKLNVADRTIRTHHPGRHTPTLVANGQEVGTATFTLA